MCTPPKSMVSGKKTSADRCIRGLQYEVGREDIWPNFGRWCIGFALLLHIMECCPRCQQVMSRSPQEQNHQTIVPKVETLFH
jgi:hypothetical protein